MACDRNQLIMPMLSAAVSFIALATPDIALGQSAGSGANASAGHDLNTIIVTANRREERAQDVPIAITAFSSQRLEQQNITKAEDLIASVPSMTVGTAGSGSRDAQTITLRGQGAAFQASPGVVIYMNEVPLPTATSLTQQGGPGNFLDLENMQVLAGPQGTLFGRNATGGAVLLVPRKPTDDFGGHIQVGIGNHRNREVQAVINAPLVKEKLALRIAGQFQDREGYTHDVTFDKNRDDVHYYSGRIGLLFRPSERFENYLMAYGARSRNNGAGNVHNQFNIAGLKGVGFCVDAPTVPSGIQVSCDVYRAATAKAKALGTRATAHSLDSYQEVRAWGLVNTSNLDLSDAIKLRNIVSYHKFKVGYLYDGDATPFQQFDVGVPQARLPSGYRNGVPYDHYRDNVRLFTEELQLQGDFLDKRLTFTAGAFLLNQKPDGVQASSQINYCPASMTGNPAACVPARSYYGTKTSSKALYAQATVDLGLMTPALDRVKLTLGYRYTWDDISGFAEGYTPAGANFRCASTATVVSNPANCRIAGELKSKAPTWLIGLDYKATDDLLLYAKVSRGYKAGGFNSLSVRETTRTFQPEYVTSYEAGFKSDWTLGDVLAQLNVNGYYLKYKGIQRAASDFNATTRASGVQILSSDARIKGVEVIASLKFANNLELSATYSHTDADYKNYTFRPATAPVKDCSGQTIPAGQLADSSCLPFQYVAPHTFSARISYRTDLPGTLGALSLYANYSHTSAQYTEAFLLPEVQPDSYFKSFGLLSLSATWSDIMGSNVDVTAYATNLTNKLYQINNTHVFQTGSLLSSAALYGEPRMYGMRVRYNF
ncbi:TonB-dependent receptor [Caenibius tardaugens]|nr:TonB-dependent receptor [Caenibius tardaugens]